MKYFLKKTLFFSLPVFFLLIIVNYYIDPANLFSSNYENKITNALLSRKNITNIDNYDDRKLQRNIINKINYCPNTIVLGSSRTMLLNSINCNNTSFFNNSVSGATIEDILGIYQLYVKNNYFPKKIILGIDPWLLNENNGQERWKSISSEYNDFLKSINKNPVDINNSSYLQLVSPSYFQSSVNMLFNKKENPIVTNKRFNRSITKIFDGSITYDQKFRQADLNIIKGKVDKFIEGKIYSIENYQNLSYKNRILFEHFIKILNDNNVEIEFFLSPYHPKVYNFIKNQKKYKNVNESEKYFLSIAKKLNIEVLGSYDPFKLNLNESHFYDGMHCNEKGVDLILSKKYKL